MTDEETIVPGDESKKQTDAKGAAPQESFVSPAASSQPPRPTEKDKNDIAHILEEVKLPERRISAPATPAVPEPAILEEHIAPSKAPATPKEEASKTVTPVRTLRDDMQTVVQEKNISLVRAVSLEEEKKRGQEHLQPEQSEIREHKRRRSVGIIFASGLLLALGALAIFGVFFVMAQKQAPTSAPVSSSILFSEQTQALQLGTLSPQDLKAQIAQAEQGQLGSLGSITRIVPIVAATSSSGQVSARLATIQEFFTALGMNPPQQLIGAIGPDFFFGIHVVDVNAPLFVIPVTSYDRAFAGMLAWEPTMNTDLAPIFKAVSMTTTGSSGIPTTRTFQDTVMRNYDARVLEDDAGNIVLYYSFPNPNLLVIAQSPYSFTEILSRLQAAREL